MFFLRLDDVGLDFIAGRTRCGHNLGGLWTYHRRAFWTSLNFHTAAIRIRIDDLILILFLRNMIYRNIQ